MKLESIPFRYVVLVTSTIGFLIGSILVPSWQDAVETGQVIGGVVNYPYDNPHYQYHIQLWTIVCQISGLALSLGMTEYTASVLLSGLMGALAFTSLATVSWALCRNGLLAIVSPCLAFAAYQTADQYGVVYPVFAMGNRSTHGILAQSFAILILGLWGGGRYRTAAFLTALMPAIHPIIGAWCWGVLLLGCISRPIFLRDRVKTLVLWFLSGLTIVLFSFLVQQWMARHVPDVSPELQEQYRQAYIEHWDLHRQPVSFASPGVFLVIGTSVLCAFTWYRREESTPKPTLYLLTCLTAASVIGIVLCGLTWIGDVLPPIVNAVMPGRFVNPIIFTAPAILVGVIGQHLKKSWAWGLLLAHTLFIVWSRVFPGEHVVFRYEAHWFEWLVAIIVLATGIAGFWGQSKLPFNRKLLFGLVVSLTLVALGASTGRLYRKGVEPPMIGRHNDVVMQAIYQGSGMLATASNIGQIQISARRPVLLNGAAIDFLPYMPSTGPGMNNIFQILYGADLLGDPPPPDPAYARYLEETYGPEYMSMRDEIPELNPGQLPGETGRALWEGWSQDEWRIVSEKLGFTQVLAFASWDINLPEVARNADVVLYDISP